MIKERSRVLERTYTEPPASSWLTRYWYYIGIAIMFVIGWFYPASGLWMKTTGITPYIIALAFFLNGFALSSNSMLGNLKQWPILCVSLVIIFGISPLLVFGMRQILPGGDSLIAHGFQVLSLVPTLFVSAVVLTRIANGNAALALLLTVTSNLLAILIAPVLIKLTLGTSAADFNLAATSISMIFTVLIPTILGQMARKRWESWAFKHSKLITIISQCTILIFIITGVSAVPRSIISPSIVLLTVTLGLVLHAVLLNIGKLGAIVLKTNETEKRALIFCTAQKSFVFNVLLCEHIFGHNATSFGLAILPGIIYYLLVLVIDSVIAQRWESQPVG